MILPIDRFQILLAGFKSGHEGTARLAAQLADAAPCPACDYIAVHCKCAVAMQSQARIRSAK